jgi:hypothetical protein
LTAADEKEENGCNSHNHDDEHSHGPVMPANVLPQAVYAAAHF